jgi:O-antigen ligase
LEKVFNTFIYGALVSSGIIITYFITGYSFGIVEEIFLTNRITLTSYGPNVVSRLFCIAALITYSKIFKQSRLRSISIEILKFIIFTFCIITTVSTAGVVMTIIGALIIHYKNIISKKTFITSITLLIIAILFALYIFDNSFMQQQIDKFILRELINAEDYDFHGRLIPLDDLISYIIPNFIIGCGYACSNILVGRTIHFPFISALVETGILGLISILMLYAYPWICILKKQEKGKRLNVINAIMFVVFLGDMIQPNPNYRFTWMMIILPCISLYNNRRNSK